MQLTIFVIFLRIILLKPAFNPFHVFYPIKVYDELKTSEFVILAKSVSSNETHG